MTASVPELSKILKKRGPSKRGFQRSSPTRIRRAGAGLPVLSQLLTSIGKFISQDPYWHSVWPLVSKLTRHVPLAC